MNEYEMTELELELWLNILSAIFGVQLPRPERKPKEEGDCE